MNPFLAIPLLALSAWPAQEAPAQEVSAQETPAPPSAAERLPGLIEAFRVEFEVPGISVAVAHAGELVFEGGFGLADVENDVAASADTVYRIASLTKQFTAAAVLRLEEQDKLKLDDDFTQYVDALDTGEHVVTIRQLLNHTSGIPNVTEIVEWRDNWEQHLAPQEVVAYVAWKEFDFEPGTKFAYNNTAYIIAGLLVEDRAGVPYAEYLETSFFEPLGLSTLQYESPGVIVPHRAHGYTRNGAVLRNADWISMTQPFSAGALLSTAEDLVRWQLALAGGEVVTPESYSRLITPTLLPDGESTGYGFGLAITEAHGELEISHSGGINGFASFLSHLPGEELVVAVLGNSDVFEPAALARRIEGLFLFPEVVALPVSEPLASKLVGRYVGEDLELSVRARDGVLRLDWAGQGVSTLLHQGAGEFRCVDDQRRRLVFDLEGDASAGVRVFFEGREVVAERQS